MTELRATAIQKSNSRIPKIIGSFLAGAVLAGLAGTLATAQSVSATRVTGADASDFPEGQACQSGIAISTLFGSVCSNVCTSDSECTLEGWACKTRIPQGDGTTIGLCFPRR